MEGFGTYQYVDGRAEVGRYAGNVDVGEGVRWSADRTTAWRLMDGKVVEEITLETADRIARKIGQSLRQESHKSAGSGGGMDRYGGGGGKPSSAGARGGARRPRARESGFGGGAKAAGMGIHAPSRASAATAARSPRRTPAPPTWVRRRAPAEIRAAARRGGPRRAAARTGRARRLRAAGYAHKGFGSGRGNGTVHSVVHGSSGSRHARPTGGMPTAAPARQRRRCERRDRIRAAPGARAAAAAGQRGAHGPAGAWAGGARSLSHLGPGHPLHGPTQGHGSAERQLPVFAARQLAEVIRSPGLCGRAKPDDTDARRPVAAVAQQQQQQQQTWNNSWWAESATAGGRSLNLFVCALEATEGGEGSRSGSS